MTVTEKSSRKVIVGAGWANPLTHDFQIENASYAHVFADDVELVGGVDYVVSDVLNPAGYTITIVVPGSWAPTNWVLDARPPIAQAKDLTVGGTFGAKFEDGLDQLTRRVERVWDHARRGLKTGLDVAVDDNPYTLPVPAADKLLGWNAAGDDLENFDPVGISIALVDNDVTLASDSTSRVPSQHAAKTYADTLSAAAVKYADTTTAAMSFVIDEDDMASDSATKVPTEQSVKAYVDGRSPKIFDTYDDALAGTVSASVELVEVSGRSAINDFGAADYAKVDALPSVGPLQIGSFFFKNTAKDFTPEHCGAKGDGSTDDQTALENWIMGAAEEGRKAVAFGGKTYMTGERITAVLTGALHLEAVGAIIKGEAGDGVVLRLDGDVTRPRASIRGLRVNNSLRNFVVAGQSGTALELVRMGRMDIAFNRFEGATTRDKGDSGITMTECDSAVIHDNHFLYQPDLGLYTTGGNDTGTTDDYGDVVIHSNLFYRCDAGFAGKRQTRRHIFSNNLVNECRVGLFNTPGAGSPTPLVSVRELIITGNHFRKTNERAMELALSQGDVVSGNQIQDWGYDGTGTTPSTIKTAIRLFGITGASVTGNTIRMRDWADSTHRAISLHAQTFDAVTTQSGGNVIGQNTIGGCSEGIIEQDSTTGNDYPDNTFSGSVTTRITYASGSTSKGTVHRSSTGGREAVYSKLQIPTPASSALTGFIRTTATPTFGTVNAGTRSVQTVTMTGVTADDVAIINPQNSSGSVNGIIFVTRCKTDAVDIEARNHSASNIAITDFPISILVIKSSAT